MGKKMSKTETTTLTLWLADKRLNEIMAAFDMCPSYKVFVLNKSSFDTDKEVTKEFLLGIIEKSRSQETFWIPAIEWDGELISAPELKIISDGKHEAFLRSVA